MLRRVIVLTFDDIRLTAAAG